MATRKVRVGSLYVYNPVLLDLVSPPAGRIAKGDVVRVVNLHGCPPANTMGHAYVNQLDGTFGGLVCTNSLLPCRVGKAGNVVLK